MTVEKVKNTLPLDEHGNVWMEMYSCFISPEGFVSRYGGDESSLTYEWLYNHEKATLTWKNQFKAWKEQGVLN